jgi:threonine 3-dehydrogenase
MSACIARFVGARHVVITDVNEYRLELAARVSGSLALDVRSQTIADATRKLGMTEGFDVGLEMSGQPSALDDLIAAVHHGAGVALLGIPSRAASIDWSRVIFKGLSVKGIYGREMFETWYKMASMLQSGLRIEPLITHRFPAARYQEAFELIRSGRSGKVILQWAPGDAAAEGIRDA